MDELTRETGIVDDMTQDYISAINEIKQNSVDRSKYDQLKAEHKKLLDSVVNGQTIDVPVQSKKADINELRRNLFDTDRADLNNLDWITNALELRSALIESGEPDPFLPVGKQISATDADIAAAERVAACLQECVDYADGNAEVFTDSLQRKLVEIKLPNKR